MKRFVSFLLVGTMVTTTIFFAGCSQEQSGDNNNGTSDEAANTGDTGTLNVIFASEPQPDEKAYLGDTFFKNFEDQTGSTVNVDYLTGTDARTRVQSEQASGNVVTDVVYAQSGETAYYIQNGWVQDITDFVNNLGVNITDTFDSATNVDGVRYFVPNTFDIYLTILNKNAEPYLNQVGLTDEDFESGISWDQYADLADAIAAGEGTGKTMFPASSTDSQLAYPLGGMSIANGGSFPDFTSDGFKSAMSTVAKMASSGALYSQEDQYSAPTDPLKSGDVWLTFAHMSPIGVAYSSSPNSYIVGPAPMGSDGRGSTAGSYCWGISTGSKNQDLAEKFITYSLTPDVNYDFCTHMNMLSPISEVTDMLGQSDQDVIMKAGMDALPDTITSGVPSSEYTDWSAVKELYVDVFNNVVKSGTVPTDDYLNQEQAQLDSLKIS